MMPVRRPLLAAAAICLAESVGAAVAAPAPATPAANLAPPAALQDLKDGNARFVSGHAASCQNATARRPELAAGQAPNAIILSCSDSRVPPEQVFDQGLGKLFVVRDAGNILNPDAIASIEYAVANLGSRLIVVLGHESCGAVKAAIQTPPGKDAGSPSLNELVTQIRSNLGAVTSSSDPKLRAPVIKNIGSVARELLLRSKIVHDAVSSGKVRIQEGIYDLDSGKVEFFGA